jgi:hypothetical protein
VGAPAGPVYVGDTAEGVVDVFTSGEGPEEAPVTASAGAVTASTAVFHGELNPGGKTGKLEYQFDYNTGAACTGGQSVPVPRGEVANASKAVVEAKATGLQPNMQYTACLLALNPFGSVQGNEVSLKTEPAPPVILSESTVVPVTAHEATLQAKINPNNQETTYHFEYAENPALTGATTVPQSEPPLTGFSPEGQQVTVNTGAVLTQGTTYYYRVVAKNASGEEATGTVEHFTTAISPETPEATTANPVAAFTATLNGVLNPGAAGDPGSYEFLYRQSASECQGAGEKITPMQPATGGHAEAVKAEISELLPNTPYTFCLRAHNQAGEQSAVSAPITFTTLVARPVIEETFATEVASTSATLNAKINPEGAPTTYTFETAAPGGAFAAVAEPDGTGTIPTGTTGVPVSVHVQHLTAATTYLFRLTIENTLTKTEGKPLVGEPITFTTQTNGEFVLPDGRQWEMVSPAAMHGALIQPLGSGGIANGATTQAAAAGGAVGYAANAPTEEHPVGSPTVVSVLSTRGTAGWSSQNIAAPHAVATGLATNSPEVRLFSDDLSLAAVQPLGSFVAGSPAASELALSPAASEQTAYLRENHTGAYTPLVTGCPAESEPCPPAVAEHADVLPGTVFGQLSQGTGLPCPPQTLQCGAVFVGGTPDLRHVILSAAVALKPGANANALYEWNAGLPASQQLQLLSLLPPNEKGEELPAPNPNLGTVLGSNPSPDQRGAVSADGSHVFFSADAHLYMRDMMAGKTVQIDAVQPGCEPEACGGGFQNPEFQYASSDGSRVFFKDTQKLTADGRAYSTQETAADLYVCELHKDTCALKDLAPSGEVRGEVTGASADGSILYFAGNGALVPGAVSGSCPNGATSEQPPPGSTCNLYIEHLEGGKWVTGLVSVVSGGDQFDWAAGLESLVARVSPGGGWFAFMSQRSLTGYDNRDAVSGRPDQEVFLYEAAHGRLTCASCDPSGARPHGVEYGNATGVPLLGNQGFRSDTWLSGSVPAWVRYGDKKALYQPRYLSDTGRLFFDSHDGLVPKDVNGTGDVYEFQPAGVPTGERECGSGTASGASVYRSAHSFRVEGGPGEVVAGEETPGCVGLMSSGSSGEESALFDVSESGGDVFFISSAKLSPLDVEGGLTLYDAHECTTGSPCVTPPAAVPPACTTEASCKAAPSPQPSIFGPSGSATFSGPGNPAPAPPARAKPKTAAQLRAEKLTRALKACHRVKKRGKRQACERAAHRRYGAKTARRVGRAATTKGRAGR